MKHTLLLPDCETLPREIIFTFWFKFEWNGKWTTIFCGNINNRAAGHARPGAAQANRDVLTISYHIYATLRLWEKGIKTLGVANR